MDSKDMVSWEDYQGCLYAFFEWAEAYDTKDWTRLAQISTPTLHIDYTAFLNQSWPAMPLSQFITMMSSPTMLGNPLVKTQHLCGASQFTRVHGTDDEIIGRHQLRVPHVLYANDADKKTIKAKGDAYSTNLHWYRRVNGRWLFAGLRPEFRFGDEDFIRVFVRKDGNDNNNKNYNEEKL